MIDKVALHQTIVNHLNKVYESKNADYGDSFTFVRDRHANAIMVRLWDKIMRLDTLMTRKDRNVRDETIEDTLTDLANYAIMELIEMRADQYKETKMAVEICREADEATTDTTYGNHIKFTGKKE